MYGQRTTAGIGGFAQLGLGIALLIIGSTHFRFAGPDSCIYGAADIHNAESFCDVVSTLAYLSVFSSLIISVAQGTVSVFWGAPPLGLEVLARGALAMAWTVLAALMTAATVQADHHDSYHAHAHWRHVGLGLCWSMMAVAWVLAWTALIGLCCSGLPCLASIACLFCWPCWCCCPRAFNQNAELHCCDENMCYLCAEVFCLGWLFRSLSGRPGHTHGDHTHSHGYAPLPGTAAAPHQHAGAVPYNYPSASFTPPAPQAPPVLHPQHGQPVHVVHVQPPTGYPPVPGAPAEHAPIPHYPAIAPVYSPFTSGPPPQNVGWGVPVYGHSVYPPVPDAPPLQQVPPTYTATVGPSSSSAPASAPPGKDIGAPSAPPAPPSS